MGQALARAIAAQEGYLELESRVPCTAILIGASVAGAVAVSAIKALDRLWGFQGDKDKATRLLETFSLRLLSTWLGWMDGDRPEEEKHRARELWGEVLLTLFDDLSEDSLNRFVGRDLQYRYEVAAREEREKTGESGGPLVGVTLLLSDAILALGGQPLIRPTPLTGYPYDSMSDMMDRGGVKEVPFTLNTLSDTIHTVHAAALGAKACAEYYREQTERLDEEVRPVLTQLKQLLSEGHSMEQLRKDAAWSTWIDFFEARGLLETGS
jgi:hypothetical protein